MTDTHNQWPFYSIEHGKKVATRFHDALHHKDLAQLCEIAQDMKALRTLILWRGENGEFLHDLLRAFSLITDTHALVCKGRSCGKSIIKSLHAHDISEDLILYCSEAAYHLRQKETLEYFVRVVKSAQSILQDPLVQYRVLHTLASWYSAVDRDAKTAIALNTEVLSHLKDTQDIYYLKAKFGLTHDKELLPKKKIADYLQLAEAFEKMHIIHDASRALVEAAQASLDLSRQQGIDEIAFETLDTAKESALRALKMAKDLHYVNLEIIASEIMCNIYTERLAKNLLMKHKIALHKDIPLSYKELHRSREKISKDDAKKSASFRKKAQELREKYHYRSHAYPRYKYTFYGHAQKTHIDK